jgi:uncharacterized protein
MSNTIVSIRYPFAVDHGLGSLSIENRYDEHVRQMMLQVLFTNPGERVNRPDFGCGIRRMVFAPNHDVSASLAQVSVFEALHRWLGEVVRVEHVEVRAEDAVMRISIVYVLLARQERRHLNVEVTV